MRPMGTKSRSPHDIAEELAARLDAPIGGGHDASDEPRVPKDNGRQSGEWTTGAGQGAPGESARGRASANGITVTIMPPDGTVEVRHGGSHAWRNNNPGNITAGPKANSVGAIG